MPNPLVATLDEYPKRCQAPYCSGTLARPTLADAVVGRVWCSDCNSYDFVSEPDRRLVIEQFEEEATFGPLSTGY